MTSKLTPDEIESKIKDLSGRHAKILKRKAELAGQLQAKKKELADLVQEITDAGFNPKTLVQDKENLQQELETLLSDFEKELSSSEEALKQFDNV
jgi:chromosome segregation ATPase